MKVYGYPEKREKLKTLYEKLECIAGELKATEAIEGIKEAIKLLDEDCFKVVVVGEFSRGKSTFTNAMLGKRILPAKSDPTTTVINCIHYGDQEKYIVHYRNSDKVKEISEQEFKTITAAELNVAEEEGELAYKEAVKKVSDIAHIELCYPLLMLEDGVEIIDTPGTNDLDQVREEITFQFIPKADAAIMLLSAEQILTKSELLFLKERILENDIKKVFFVVNFKDRLMDEKDGERILDTARKYLLDIIPNPRLFLVSSRDALRLRRKQAGESLKPNLYVPESLQETGFAEFEQALGSYLSKEKGYTKLEKYHQRFQGIAGELIDSVIKINREKIGINSRELATEIEKLRPSVERAKQNSRRVFERLQFSLELVADELTQDYKRGLGQLARKVVMSVNDYNGPLRPEDVARAIEQVTAPLQQSHELNIQKAVNDKLNYEYSQAKEKLRKIFKTEHISTGSELMVIGSGKRNLPACHMEIERINTDDINIVGGGMLLGGAILAINMPFIAIPAALFGGKFFMERFEEYKRNGFISQVSQQVRNRYEMIIPEQTEGFNREIKKRFADTISRIESIINEHMEMNLKQLERMLEEKQLVECDEKKEKERLDKLEIEIKRLVKEAAEING